MRSFAAALVAGSLSLFLIGCSTGTVSDLTGTTKIAATGVHGIVHGGQQPVTGSTVTLWSVGAAGYGSAGTSLATTTTDSTGSFNITGSYTCPASDPYVYITSTGGNPGLGGSVNNTAISLMAALTDCNTLKTNAASTYIVINEATTVASAYALAQFMNTSTGAIGSYSYSTTGMTNAFSTVTNMVSTSTGNAYSVTPNGNGVVPQSEINTLADILAACVNTSSGSSTACSTLFSNVQGSPGNTLLAALQIALHPANNVSSLYALAGGAPPFQPTLGAAPNDWTIALSFNMGSTLPRQLAIDSGGNVWTTNFVGGGTTSTLSKINTLGVPQNGSPFHTNMNGASGLAIDIADDAWVGNTGNGTLVGYSNAGGPFAGPLSGLSSPLAMAFDKNNNLWIANNGNSSLSEFSLNTFSFVSSGYTSQITTPFAVAMDASGNAWVANASTVTELSSSGVASAASPISSGGINTPSGVAIDGSSNVWISNNTTGNLAELNSAGTALSGSGYSGGGLGPSNGVAIDGAGNVWVTDRTLNRLTEFNSSGTALTPSTGYQGGSLNGPKALAIDGSGNIWVANNAATTTGGITTFITEFVGLGAPTIQPLVSALVYGQIGQEPGTPIPVTIGSNAVPYYTAGFAYSAQLYAQGGNSGTYTFSSSSTFPAGLSISSGGLISGTTSATGSTAISVKACDAANTSNCSSPQSFTLTANTTLTALGNESAVSGSYAMLFEGYKNNPGVAQVSGIDILAGLTFSGTGTITGEIDINNKNLGSAFSTSVSGYYTFGADNRGTMVLTPSGGSSIEYAIVGENFSGSKPQTLRIIEFDDTGISTDGVHAVGSGIAKLQTSAAFVQATLNQSFAFGLQGETPCNNDGGVNPTCAAISPFGPLSVVGQFTGDNANSITSGEEDAAGVNNTWNAVTLTGTYANPDTSGRGTLSLAPSGTTYPAAGQNFIYYIVNSGEIFLMTRDGHATKSMLAGDALVQSASLGNSTLTGNYVAYEQSPSDGDGFATLPSSLDSSLIYLSVQSGSQITATIDENNGSNSNVKLEQTQGPFTYSIASNGRMTITGAGSGVPVFYVADSGAFFGTEQPSASNQGGPGLITGQQQTAGTFTCGPTSGNFAIALPPLPIATEAISGEFLSGTSAFTIDLSSGGALVQGLSGTTSCTTDSLTSTTGRFVLSTTVTSLNNSTEANATYTIVPNSKYVLMSIDPNSGQPQITTIEK